MAYSMVHLEIAYRLLDKFDWISNPGDFLLGALAPDAVHFQENYHYHLKERSHVWDCGPRWGITTDPDKWKRDILRFWEGNKNALNRDFIAGYCVHLLTDVMNGIIIWGPFQEANVKGTDVESAYHIYGKEAYESDQWLFQNSENSKEIMKLLEGAQVYGVDGCIEKEYVEQQKKFILTENYASEVPYDISRFQYCTEKVLRNFIEECVKMIGEELVLQI